MSHVFKDASEYGFSLSADGTATPNNEFELVRNSKWSRDFLAAQQQQFDTVFKARQQIAENVENALAVLNTLAALYEQLSEATPRPGTIFSKQKREFCVALKTNLAADYHTTLQLVETAIEQLSPTADQTDFTSKKDKLEKLLENLKPLQTKSSSWSKRISRWWRSLWQSDKEQQEEAKLNSSLDELETYQKSITEKEAAFQDAQRAADRFAKRNELISKFIEFAANNNETDLGTVLKAIEEWKTTDRDFNKMFSVLVLNALTNSSYLRYPTANDPLPESTSEAPSVKAILTLEQFKMDPGSWPFEILRTTQFKNLINYSLKLGLFVQGNEQLQQVLKNNKSRLLAELDYSNDEDIEWIHKFCYVTIHPDDRMSMLFKILQENLQYFSTYPTDSEAFITKINAFKIRHNIQAWPTEITSKIAAIVKAYVEHQQLPANLSLPATQRLVAVFGTPEQAARFQPPAPAVAAATASGAGAPAENLATVPSPEAATSGDFFGRMRATLAASAAAAASHTKQWVAERTGDSPRNEEKASAPPLTQPTPPPAAVAVAAAEAPPPQPESKLTEAQIETLQQIRLKVFAKIKGSLSTAMKDQFETLTTRKPTCEDAFGKSTFHVSQLVAQLVCKFFAFQPIGESAAEVSALLDEINKAPKSGKRDANLIKAMTDGLNAMKDQLYTQPNPFAVASLR